MRPIQTIQLGERHITFNGREHTATIVAYVYYDETFRIDWEMPEDERKELASDIERGRLDPCGIEVRASIRGFNGKTIDGSDSCWGFLIGRHSEIMENIQDHGMIDNALSELSRELADAIVDARQILELYA